MRRYCLALCATLLACLGLQSLALRASGGRTLKSESNYFSSLARMQTEPRGTPRILLLGSSMTGRLGDRARRQPGVANLGCDGGSAVVALRALDHGLLPAGPLLVIEANTLPFELEHRGKEIAAAIDSPWFRFGQRAPNFGATARPTAFAYSWLIARQRGRDDGGPPLAAGTVAEVPAMVTLTDPAEDRLAMEISAMLTRLRQRGSKSILVMLPPGMVEDSQEIRIARSVAARSQTPFWNLAAGLPAHSVGFSDGLHLDAPSANKVMRLLLERLAPP